MSIALQSFLVDLGFTVNNSELRTFQTALRDAARSVESSTGGVIKQIAGWQGAIVGAFAAVGGSILGLADHVAQQDLQWQLMGQRMMMRTQDAKHMDVALKALGATIEEVTWNPELRARFEENIAYQKKLERAFLGPEYEKNMRSIRDVRQQISLLQVGVQHFLIGFVSQLVNKLGGVDSVIEKLKGWQNWLLEHGPKLAAMFADEIVPVLEKTWTILKQLARAGEVVVVAFVNLIGALTGDSAIQGTTLDFDKLGHALGHVADMFAEVGNSVTRTLSSVSHLVSALSLLSTGHFSAAKVEFQAALQDSGANDKPIDLAHPMTNPGNTTNPTAPGDVAREAYQLAQGVGQKTGINPRLIFEQWAHETGGFTSKLTKDMNNLAGIRLPGSTEYRNFQSLSDFADYYGKLVQNKNYSAKGVPGSQNEEQLAGALKKGGYYEDSYQNYVAGMKRWSGMYEKAGQQQAAPPAQQLAGQQVSIGAIHINVTQPNASPEQLQKYTTNGVSEALRKQNQLMLAQFTPSF